MITDKSKKLKSVIALIFLVIISILIGFGLFYSKNLFASKHVSTNYPKFNKIAAAAKVKKPIEKGNKAIITANTDAKSPIGQNTKSTSQDAPITTANTTYIDSNTLSLVDRSDRDEFFNSPMPFNNNVFSLNRKAGKIVALTFDDGPSKEFTKKYVDILKNLNVKATFFVVGRMAEKNPDLLKYIVDNGEEIGLHSYSHSYMPKMTPQQMVDELYKTQAIVVNATGIKPNLFRPPYGAFNNTLLKISNALGLHVVLWSVDPDDWKRPGTLNIVNRIVSKAGPGSVILMHEGKPETFAALPQIIEKLKSEGYGFATISDLMNGGNTQ
ncbi:polysaccharide deacetylase family protein [Thermoanaerobacterium sp. RBIITD]|uniref:polysaccharide deacetylase family protein n=1 Tax=Thermoanaerobacterium sp. RBIITD TaxID=1550240 RepID=UPI000BB6E4AD|nr:polysaccharide deacetylase family protein [Thermoanaerobacterium sp. RBIITD]SNX55117.1 polysaccharide deacetylase family sporulation protein PdaB [Thermoanaerobacterium sp. RBIITD]